MHSTFEVDSVGILKVLNFLFPLIRLTKCLKVCVLLHSPQKKHTGVYFN